MMNHSFQMRWVTTFSESQNLLHISLTFLAPSRYLLNNTNIGDSCGTRHVIVETIFPEEFLLETGGDRQ